MLLTAKKKSPVSLERWVLYFLSLGVIQAMWTNLYAFPPLFLRIAMIAAVFIPVILRRDLMLFVFPFFLTLRGQLSTAYQYLPDANSYSFYISVLLLCIFIHRKHLQPLNFKAFKPYLFLALYFLIVDFLCTGYLGLYSTNFLIVLLLALFIKTEFDFELLSLSLVLVCGFLAIYYIVMFDKFLVSWGAESEGIERSGWSDPNYYSTLLAIGFQISLFYLFGFLKSRFILLNSRLALIAICSVIFGAVIMCASRGGFLCLTFGFLTCFLLIKPNIKVYFITFLLVIVLLSYLYSKGIFDVLLYRLFEQGNMDTGGERTVIWARVLDNFSIQSIILQIFGGGYWHRTVLSHGWETHNEFIAILADYGFVGIMLFLNLIFSMLTFKSSHQRVRNISVIFYILSILSLSQFQFMSYCFFIVWILGYKKITTNRN